MKNLLILLLVIASATSIFAQKGTLSTWKKNASVITTLNYSCPKHPEMTSAKPGKCPKCGMDLTLSNKEQMKAEVTQTYKCPMHPDVVSNHPGNCPKCKSKFVVDRSGSKQVAAVYTCGMHPDVSSTIAGKCPICGVEMVAKKTKQD